MGHLKTRAHSWDLCRYILDLGFRIFKMDWTVYIIHVHPREEVIYQLRPMPSEEIIHVTT